MHNLQLNILKLLPLLLIIIIMAGCNELRNKKILRIGVSGQMPPYSYHDEQTNELVGFDIDIANEISKKLDKKLDIKEYSYNRLIAAVLSGQIDFGMGSMNIVPEREEVVDFTEPYNISRGKFVVYTKLIDIKTIEDIRNSKYLVGIRNGTVYPTILVNNYSFNHDQLKIFPSQRDLAIALKNGTVQVAISDSGAMYHLDKHSDLDFNYIGEITSANAGITVNKNNIALKKELDKAIKAIKEDGTYEKIAVKWFGENPFTSDSSNNENSTDQNNDLETTKEESKPEKKTEP